MGQTDLLSRIFNIISVSFNRDTKVYLQAGGHNIALIVTEPYTNDTNELGIELEAFLTNRRTAGNIKKYSYIIIGNEHLITIYY